MITLRQAFRFWLKLGFISFGGPAGQIAIMHTELVERRRWISERRFLHALNYCMLLPGPEAQQLATYIGWLMHGVPGGIMAGGLFVLPSLLMLIGLSWMYVEFGAHPLIAGVFYAIKPAVTAIVVHAAYRIGSRTIDNWLLALIALAAFVAIAALQAPFPLVIAGAALIGVVGARVAPRLFRAAPHAAAHAAGGEPPAMIDDATSARAPRLAPVLLLGAALWTAPMALLVALHGSHGILPAIGLFFTKAALLTFGGAYAVLPYVHHGAVVDHKWLSTTQMIDGLALGETTPGPLIMIVAFVGFVGGYQSAELAAWLGPDHRLLAGTIAACLATWFTFLPSFIFIFAGAPLIESSRMKLHDTSPLTAITAAVVGVILNLALFFARQTLWPSGGSVDWIAASICAAALLALFKWRRGVIEVICGAALIGLFIALMSGG